MMNARICLPLHRLAIRLFSLLLLILAVLTTGPGCRDKDNPVTPGDSTPSLYRLELLPPAILYLGPGGYVENDTIPVRVFNSTGGIVAGVTVRARALISPDSIGPVVRTRSDTTRYPWGTDIPLIYWGSGRGEQTETFVGFAVLGTDTVDVDTVHVQILVGPRPQ